MNLKRELSLMQSYCIDLGRLEVASEAIGYDAILNGDGETLEDRKQSIKNRINEIREKILNELHHQT